ncbi:MAG: elongation factor P [Planctomycetaceae bacterium]|nr:elongation factor P [Planctomycetaceae bacterium]
MPQINASDFRKGVKVIIEGDPYDMLDCNFVKPGKGQALYKCRLRNLLKNTIIDRTYKSGDGLEAADVRKGDAQFLYRDKDQIVFMDQETFEQYNVHQDIMGDKTRWLMDGMVCNLMYYNDRIIDVVPPPHVNVKIIYAEPAVRGNTSGNITKTAKVETGAEVQVPAFIDQGETIRINTETGQYVERVKM